MVVRRIVTHREQIEALIPLRIATMPDAPEWAQKDWRTATDYGHFNSTSRPPMSSDMPHPSKVNVSTPTRRKVEASEDPDNDPWNVLGGTGISFEDLVNNHVAHHQAMDPDQQFKGRTWYRAAHDITKDLSQKTLGDHGRTVGVLSAYSPVKDWDSNVEQAIHFLTHYDGSDPNFRMPKAPADQTADAIRVYNAPQGTDYSSLMPGPKTSAFFHNILDPSDFRAARDGVEDDDGYYDIPINPYTGQPDWRMAPDQDVTVDTHHVRMSGTPHGSDMAGMKYATPPYFDRKVMIDGVPYKPGYDLHARAAAEATRRINAAQQDPARYLIPKQTQAGPWGKFKQDLINAGISKVMPETGDMPKHFRKVDPNDAAAVEKWKDKHQLNEPIPAYQRDHSDDWWEDPRRPDVNLRATPNWNRHLSATDLRDLWDTFYDAWSDRRYPHRKVIEASRVLQAAQGLIGGW